MMKINITLVLVLIMFCLAEMRSQTDSLIVDSLRISIHGFYQEKAAAEIEQFKIGGKGAWMSYLPSVGLAYTPSGSPRPSVSFSFATIISLLNNRRMSKQTIKAIEEQNRLQETEQQSKLSLALVTFYQTKKKFKNRDELYRIESDLFLIQESKYKRKEITPENYLKARKTYLMQTYSLDDMRADIEIRRAEVLEIAKLVF